MDVNTEKSWRVKQRHCCHLIGRDSFNSVVMFEVIFQITSNITHVLFQLFISAVKRGLIL
jgi:hypothetical protein